jgi:hypothetical protein
MLHLVTDLATVVMQKDRFIISSLQNATKAQLPDKTSLPPSIHQSCNPCQEKNNPDFQILLRALGVYKIGTQSNSVDSISGFATAVTKKIAALPTCLQISTRGTLCITQFEPVSSHQQFRQCGMAIRQMLLTY